ncbi:MAG: transposase zinc-binding domain-containing protein [Sandaracinaceae bacterium]|nr:transposase zinc-binding domain-containing protein [Sandaracinaceae bacterium]
MDTYRPRRPADSALHRVLTEHIETFLDDAAMSRADSLPRFVATELREFLRCGILSEGFARMHCDHCGHDRLVGLSCKGRGFCPSCGGRRMTELAAHLVDNVLPFARTRQWVLSLPFSLRAPVAWNHDVALAVQRIVVRAILTDYRRRARKAGIVDGRAGAVCVIQRFGSALNLNPHFHLVVPDGVFAPDNDGALRFHPTKRFARADIERVAERIRARVTRLIEKRDEQNDHAADPLAACYASSLANAAAREPAAQERLCSSLHFTPSACSRRRSPLAFVPASKVLTCMLVSSSPNTNASNSNTSVATSHAPLFRTTASHSLTTAASASNSRRHGATAPRTSRSTRSHFAHA